MFGKASDIRRTNNTLQSDFFHSKKHGDLSFSKQVPRFFAYAEY